MVYAVLGDCDPLESLEIKVLQKHVEELDEVSITKGHNTLMAIIWGAFGIVE